MTFLSQVPQHELRIRAGRKPDGPNVRHRDIMSIFGQLGDNARSEANILFRIERLPGQAPSYLIRSDVPPSNMPSGGRTLAEPEQPPAKGAAVVFRIAVNAVQRTKSGVRPVFPDGALEELVESGQISETEAARAVEITPWLHQHLNPGLTDIRIVNHQREVVGRGRRGQNQSGEAVAVQIDTIDGIALVDDPEELKKLLENGIGRAKSYGCGLLTVRPL